MLSVRDKNWGFINDHVFGHEDSILSQSINSFLEEQPLPHLVDKTFISCILKTYGDGWGEDSDFFENLCPEAINALQNKQAFFIFDTSDEGYCPICSFWFDAIYANCERYKIDPSQIIFASSNLKSEQLIDDYHLNHLREDKKKINVLSWTKFERHEDFDEVDYTTPENYYKSILHLTEENYNGKYFSSLCRQDRIHKSAMQFLLWKDLQPRGLISHPELDNEQIQSFQKSGIPDCLMDLHKRFKLNKSDMSKWVSELPLIADRTDFHVNWGSPGFPFEHLHHQTLFQIVNETWGDEWQDRSIFYSEKTFVAISMLTPFVINGPVGSNMYLKNIGYELYDDWFDDYSFDSEESYVERCLLLSKLVKKVCDKLENMSRKEQIAWKFKNKEILLHNHDVFLSRRYSSEKIKNFLKALSSI